jgi:hypothetical protein
VQLFRRSEMEVRAGDLLKFTATDAEQGQMASQRYTVESVSETGNIRLKGENGRITINPQAVRAQQHMTTAGPSQGTVLRGPVATMSLRLRARKAGVRHLPPVAFYISASRVKEHVQIYTDGKADWVKAVKTPERDIKTAHDALAPETQRKQAKAIWAMGQPVNKTAIGRAWVRHQGMQDASLTAKSSGHPALPEPALALPVYDNNGRSAGLALVSGCQPGRADDTGGDPDGHDRTCPWCGTAAESVRKHDCGQRPDGRARCSTQPSKGRCGLADQR